MTDALSQIAKDQREVKKLIEDGIILKCHICWSSVKNNKQKLAEHIYKYHIVNEVIDQYADLYYSLWNDSNTDLRKNVNRLYKIKQEELKEK